MHRLLYIRGEPGSGKLTVAKLLEAELGWTLFWLHDLDAICEIVGSSKIPRLMDKISCEVVEHLLNDGKDIIYVRPSRESRSVDVIRRIVSYRPDYVFHLVSLTASYEKLVKRVTERDRVSNWRIHDKVALDDYLARPPVYSLLKSLVIRTDNTPPTHVAKIIRQEVLGL